MSQAGQAGWTEATPPGGVPKITSIFDFSAEALGELRLWLEQAGLSIPITNVIGYQQNSVRVYKRSLASLDVVNTATSTSILSETIPGGSLSTTSSFRVTIFGDYLNNTGGVQDIKLKITFGATTLVDFPIVGLVASASRGPSTVEFIVQNIGSYSSNFLGGQYWIPNPGTATSTGIYAGGGGGGTVFTIASSGASSVDTSVSQTINVEVKHGVANANLSWRRQWYMIEFL